MYLAYTTTIYILDKLNEIVAKNIYKQRGLKFISEY